MKFAKPVAPPLCFFCRAPLDGFHPFPPEACRDALAALLREGEHSR